MRVGGLSRAVRGRGGGGVCSASAAYKEGGNNNRRQSRYDGSSARIGLTTHQMLSQLTVHVLPTPLHMSCLFGQFLSTGTALRAL